MCKEKKTKSLYAPPWHAHTHTDRTWALRLYDTTASTTSSAIVTIKHEGHPSIIQHPSTCCVCVRALSLQQLRWNALTGHAANCVTGGPFMSPLLSTLSPSPLPPLPFYVFICLTFSHSHRPITLTVRQFKWQWHRARVCVCSNNVSRQYYVTRGFASSAFSAPKHTHTRTYAKARCCESVCTHLRTSALLVGSVFCLLFFFFFLLLLLLPYLLLKFARWTRADGTGIRLWPLYSAGVDAIALVCVAVRAYVYYSP